MTVASISRRSFGRWLPGLASIAAAGCGSKPPPAPAPPPPALTSMEITVTADVNPDARGRPSPVVLRVYELKATSAFDAADFVSLFEKDQAVLGADLVARDEFVLSPGQLQSIRRPATDARFLAVMAAFRDLERSRWRASTALRPGAGNACAIRLEGTEIFVGAR